MRPNFYKAITIAAFAVAAVGCGTAANVQPSVGTNSGLPAQPPASARPSGENASLRSGKDLYTMNCLTCHKASGKGGRVTVEGQTLNPDDLTSAKMKAKTDEKLYSYIADGIVDEGMPAFKDTLKPEEIQAIVAHLRTLQN